MNDSDAKQIYEKVMEPFGQEAVDGKVYNRLIGRAIESTTGPYGADCA